MFRMKALFSVGTRGNAVHTPSQTLFINVGILIFNVFYMDVQYKL